MVAEIQLPNPTIANQAAVDAAVAAEATDRSAADDVLTDAIADEVAARNDGDDATLASARAYTDALLAQRITKTVRVVSIDDVVLSAPGDTFDTVTFTDEGIDDLFLVGQTDATNNGLWVWNGATNPLTRREDADSSDELPPGLLVVVTDGSLDNRDSIWELTTNAPIVLGMTPLSFEIKAGRGAGFITQVDLEFAVDAETQARLESEALLETPDGAQQKADAARDAALVLVAGAQYLQGVDYTAEVPQQRQGTPGFAIAKAFGASLPDIDRQDDPHPGNPVPGDILFKLASSSLPSGTGEEDLATQLLRPSTVKRESYSRRGAAANTGSSLSTGLAQGGAIVLYAGEPYDGLMMFMGGTGLTSPTHQWFWLADDAFNVLRTTTDDTTTAWLANNKKVLYWGTTFVPEETAVFYAGAMVAASNAGQLAAIGINAGLAAETPIINFRDNAHTGLTDPSSAPSAWTPTVISSWPWVGAVESV